MSTVTFPAVAGGATYTDDSNATTGLAGGGHRTRFIPSLKAVVDTAADVVAKYNTVEPLLSGLAGVASPATVTLTADQVNNSILDNIGQTAAADLALPACAAGMNFMMVVGQATAYAWRVRASATDKIYLNGTAGADNGYVGITTPTVGAYITAFAFKTGASSYDWFITVGNGSWVAA